VMLDEFVQVVQDLALSFGEWKHVVPLRRKFAQIIRKRKAKVKAKQPRLSPGATRQAVDC
jgi:hypothetical protein